MTYTRTIVRSASLAFAVSLLAAALLSVSAQAGETPAASQIKADTASAPVPSQTQQVTPPSGAVGFGWG